jgi:hypothetical protein
VVVDQEAEEQEEARLQIPSDNEVPRLTIKVRLKYLQSGARASYR